MVEHFRYTGISFQTSSINIREQLSFNEDENRKFITQLKELFGLGDILLLSTCNRTEIYYTASEDLNDKIISLMCFTKNVPKESVRDCFQGAEGIEAVKHLYSVSLGLEAKVLGDIQISNQVKHAYQYAADEGTAGPLMHRLLHSIFFANKRVEQETNFRKGAASTSYASVELVKQIGSNFIRPKILVLGLGEIGKDVVGNLKEIEAEITLANRTQEKAQALCTVYGYHFLDFDTALSKIEDFDIIISCVQTETPIITTDQITKQSIAYKLFVDLSVPRSISTDIENNPGFLLYNIDEISHITEEAREDREKAIPQVKSIRDESIHEFMDWSKELMVTPVIQKFKKALEEIRREELAHYLRNADESESKLVNEITDHIIQKVIKLPIVQLKAACQRGNAESMIDSLNDLFNLDMKHEVKVNK